MTQTSDIPAQAPGGRGVRPRLLPVWACVLCGVGAALAGLLPWIVTGARLPLQNLWATATAPGDMPLVLLPFSQYALTGIIGLLVVGSAAGGLVARSLRARVPRRGRLAVFSGLLVFQIIAIAQTAVTVRAGLQPGSTSAVYLALLVGVAVLSVAVGAGTFWLIAAAPRGGALVGLGVGALALGPWLTTLVAPLGSAPSDAVYVIQPVLRWVPPLAAGAAIAWAGLRTAGRVVAALGVLALVWIVPGLQSAIGAGAGMRVLAGHPGEMLDYGLAVLGAAVTTPQLVLPALGAAIAAAVIGGGVKAVVAARRNAGGRPGVT